MKKIFVLIVTAIILSACANTETKIYSPSALNQTDVWSLEFQYEAGATELTQKSSGDSEVKILNEGRSGLDLALRDDIFWSLKDDHGINVVKNNKSGYGRILIHPIHFQSGGFHSVSVVFEDSSKEPIARIKVENGNRNATFKRAADFAKYAAKAIADTLKAR